MNEQFRRALAPTPPEIASLPLSSNARAAADLLAGAGRSVLDIGCGEGKFTRSLTSLFAEVHGVDVKARKISEAQEAAQREGVRVDFREASGEALPYANGAFDAVVFSNSLHHMPDPATALREAMRVLAAGGVLYVMEPVAAGNYHEATKLVNDETEVRTQAYRDLMAIEGATPKGELLYRGRRSFASFDEWRADQLDRDLKRRAKFDAQPEVVRSRFETSAQREDGRFVFDQVFRVNLLVKAAT